MRQKSPPAGGIVINPFTAPFVLPKELYEGVERMVSLVGDEEEDD